MIIGTRNVLGHAIMDVVVWLRSLGLGKYEAVFRENDIDETVLPNLTAEDLKEKSVRSALVGLLAVIAALHPDCRRAKWLAILFT
jgi:hypothetical protein